VSYHHFYRFIIESVVGLVSYGMADESHSTGYGAHGDYLFGWKGDALQRGMDALGTTCGGEDCTGVLRIQDGRDAIGCTKAQQAKEDVGTDNCGCFRYFFRVYGFADRVYRAYGTTGRCCGSVRWEI
jgi:hypothetical protein